MSAAIPALATMAVGKLFGGKDDDPQQVAQAAAASAPTQTAGQIEATNFLMPKLKDWMTNTPQITASHFKPSPITVGGQGFTFGGAAPVNVPTTRDPSFDANATQTNTMNGTQAGAQTGSTIRATPIAGASPVVGQAAVPEQNPAQSFNIAAPLTFDKMERAPTLTNVTAAPTFAATHGTEGSYQGLDMPNGYDASYLRNLEAQGIAPLNKSYNESMSKAKEEMARLGLDGSGFQQGKMFGTQSDSVTTGYNTQAEALNRDIAIKGAEAQREDQKAKALADESNRQWWANFGQGQTALDQESANKTWANNLLGTNTNNDNASKTWASNLEATKIDQANAENNWAQNMDLTKFLTGREDTANAANIAQDIGLQKDNITITEDGIKNLLAMITGQQGAANLQNSTYQNAVANQTTQNNTNAANTGKVLSQIDWGGIFGKKTPTTTTVPTGLYTQQTGFNPNSLNFR